MQKKRFVVEDVIFVKGRGLIAVVTGKASDVSEKMILNGKEEIRVLNIEYQLYCEKIGIVLKNSAKYGKNYIKTGDILTNA